MTLIAHIRHRFGGFTIEAELQTEAHVTALSGPSGSGKTTLIRVLAGLVQPEYAKITLGGKVLADTVNDIWMPPYKRGIGVVFQDARLFPHMSVANNLAYGNKTAASDGSLLRIAEMLGIEELLDRRPGTLSGGETQRVALGRALLSEPRLILLDEPLAALDDERKNDILPYLERMKDAGGPPMIYVSHAMDEILRLADQLVLIRKGRTVRSGALEDMLADPAAVRDLGPRVAGAVVRATLVERDAGDGLSRLAISDGSIFLPTRPEPEGTMLRVRISASDVMLSRDRPDNVSALNIIPVTIADIHEGLGPGVAVALQSGSDRLLARITRRSARMMGIELGQSCFAVIKSVSVAPGDISTPGEHG